MRACLHTIALVILLGATALAQDLPDNALLVGHCDFDEGESQWVADRSPFALSGFLGSRLDPDENEPRVARGGPRGRLPALRRRR